MTHRHAGARLRCSLGAALSLVASCGERSGRERGGKDGHQPEPADARACVGEALTCDQIASGSRNRRDMIRVRGEATTSSVWLAMCDDAVSIGSWGTTSFYDGVRRGAERRIGRECVGCAVEKVADGVKLTVDVCLSVTPVERDKGGEIRLYGEPASAEGVRVISVEDAVCRVNEAGRKTEWLIKAGEAKRQEPTDSSPQKK